VIRSNNSFSCMLIKAIAMILDREYLKVKEKWLQKGKFNKISTLHSVDAAIKRKLRNLEETLTEDVLPPELQGPLVRKLLQIVSTPRSLKIDDLDTGMIERELAWIAGEIHAGRLFEFAQVEARLADEDFTMMDGILKGEGIPLPPPTVAPANVNLAGEKEYEIFDSFLNKMREKGDKSELERNLENEILLYKQSCIRGDEREIRERKESVMQLMKRWNSEKTEGREEEKKYFLLLDDVSQGTTPFPLRCVNEWDDEQFPKITFVSECFDSRDLKAADEDHLSFTPGCQCEGSCDETGGCICAQEMFQQRFPYDERGCLVNWPVGYPIYECNANCKCDRGKCRNRVVQKGWSPDVKLEVRRSLHFCSFFHLVL